MANNYRNVDIDALDENTFQDEEDQPSENEASINQKLTQLRELMNKYVVLIYLFCLEIQELIVTCCCRGQAGLAVAKGLEENIANTKNQVLREKCVQAILEALLAVKATEMAGLVKNLRQPEVDSLMRFIYRGLSQPETYNSNVLLQWHAQATEVGGLGCIERVLVSRRPL